MLVCDRELAAKTRQKLTGEIDINEMYEQAKDAVAAEEVDDEEFDLSEEPATAA